MSFQSNILVKLFDILEYRTEISLLNIINLEKCCKYKRQLINTFLPGKSAIFIDEYSKLIFWHKDSLNDDLILFQKNEHTSKPYI